jgi:hypothetical protein
VTIPAHVNDREYQKFNETGGGLVSVRTSDDNIILNVGGVITSLTLNSTTWTALTPSPLSTRKTVAVQNQSNGEIKLSYSDTTPGYVGVAIAKGGERVYNLSADVMLYGKCVSGAASVVVEEVG